MPVRKTKSASDDTDPSRSSNIAAPTQRDKRTSKETAPHARQVTIQNISCDHIQPNPFQAREFFNQSSLKELAASIHEHGLITRIRVRPHPTNDGFYQLVYGERRWKAAKIAGLTSISCEISNYSDAELFEIGLIENIQREDLGPLEEAKVFRRLLEQAESPPVTTKHYSIRRLARRLGKNKNYIEERLALLRLPDDVLLILKEHPKVSLRALSEVAKLPTLEARAPIVSNLKNGTMSTEDVRTIVNTILEVTRSSTKTEHMIASQTITDTTLPLLW